MIFVDTNYFLRYLLNDIPEQYEKAAELFLEGADSKVVLITSSVVFFEILWVLRSFYKLTKEEAIGALRKVLKLSFIQLQDRDILTKTIQLFERTTLDLEDCYNLYYAKSEKVTGFKTFDKKLEREFNNQ